MASDAPPPHARHGHTEDGGPGEMERRVQALRTVLAEKGYIDPAALDVLIDTYETKVGPRNGARVVARAWTDPGYAGWLKRDATAAVAEMGFQGRQAEHMIALFNTPAVHNMVVCTLCS